MASDVEIPLTEHDERYEMLHMIANGGSSSVWLAHDRQLQRYVAAKVLAGGSSGSMTTQSRFHREARHIASMSHPNIVTVFDLRSDWQYGSVIYMEYVGGPSFDKLLRGGQHIPIAAAVQVALDALAGLGHAHERGITHRDMKPGNILIPAKSGPIKVADFGISKYDGETSELTVQGSFLGTATYASPEQLMGRRVGAATDLYSLGCVLYEALCGRPPFIADDVEKLVLQHRFAEPEAIQSIRPEVPDRVAAAVHKALAKSPTDRFPDARSMRSEFTEDLGAAYEQWHAGADLASLCQTTGNLPKTWIQVPGRPSSLPNRSVPAAATLERVDPATTEVPAPKTRSRRRWVMAAGVGLVLGLATLLVCVALIHGTAHPGRVVENTGLLPSGGFLQPGQSIASPGDHFELTMQSDGNLVVYAKRSRVPVWESGTSGNFGAYAVMQADGDFVVYPKGKTSPPPGQPTSAVWSSGTFGNPHAHVVLSESGNLRVYSSEGRTLWESNSTP